MRTYPEVGGLFGEYEIRRLLGRGGMGAVFEAHQPRLSRLVALKVLSPELTAEDDFRRRFTHEASTLARLDSPHVVSLFDYGEHEDALFIAMHLIDGQDLSAMLGERGTLDPETSLDVAAQVAEGLSDAHAMGLVHRDVKPGNVLVRQRQGQPYVYLCDFGIARSEASMHTRTTGVVGSVGYMAPERHRGESADERSDIYSLGCLLWACLSGRAPYAGTSDVQVAIAHLQDPVPALEPSTPTSRRLDAVIAKAMAKDPDDRYASADEMRQALRRTQQTIGQLIGQGQEPAQRRPATDETMVRPRAAAHTSDGRRQPPSQRRRAVAWLAVVAVLTLLMAAGVTAVLRRADDSPERLTTRTRFREPVTCWDDRTAVGADNCPAPTGAAGLRSVFASFDAGRCKKQSSITPGKTLVYDCLVGNNYTIRYSRWHTGSRARRFRYLDRANPSAKKAAWVLAGENSGETWTSYETVAMDRGEPMRYQWSATYDMWPFEVSVEGTTRTARARGMKRVKARAASLVGLR